MMITYCAYIACNFGSGFQWLPNGGERVPVASECVLVASQRFSMGANRFRMWRVAPPRLGYHRARLLVDQWVKLSMKGEWLDFPGSPVKTTSMRFLLLANNNSLSHLTKCLALREKLGARGHEVIVAAGHRHVSFLTRLDIEHVVLPDIQEVDGSPVPTFAWFQPQRFEKCVLAEVDLLRQLQPDRSWESSGSPARCRPPWRGCPMIRSSVVA